MKKLLFIIVTFFLTCCAGTIKSGSEVKTNEEIYSTISKVVSNFPWQNYFDKKIIYVSFDKGFLNNFLSSLINLAGFGAVITDNAQMLAQTLINLESEGSEEEVLVLYGKNHLNAALTLSSALSYNKNYHQKSIYHKTKIIYVGNSTYSKFLKEKCENHNIQYHFIKA